MIKIIFTIAIVLTGIGGGVRPYIAIATHVPCMKEEHFEAIKSALGDEKHVKFYICVIYAESRFKENAFNPVTIDYGIAQINRAHKNAEQYMDWRKGIKYGAAEMKRMIKRGNGDLAIASAMYNGGPRVNLYRYNGWRSYVGKVCFLAYDMKDIRI